MDTDTKILLLPQPESKRKTKIIETVYSLMKVGDLVELNNKIEASLDVKPEVKETKRFEDMT